MAKRFTDTEKWKDAWFVELSVNGKMLFIFLCDNCDIAGFYERSDKIMGFFIGMSPEEINDATKEISKSVAYRDGIYFVKNFIIHQKNYPLNPDNNCHKGIILKLEKYSETFKENYKQYLGADKPLIRGIGKGKGKGKDKDIVYSDDFLLFWNVYPRKEGKGYAFECWEKRKKPIPAIGTVIESVERYKQSNKWKENNGKYIPHPSTWLNKRCWEDEIVVVPKREFLVYKPKEQ